MPHYLKLDNVILTPHALCWTDQCFAGMGPRFRARICNKKRENAQALADPSVAMSHFQEKTKAYQERFKAQSM
ncbi:MAG: hypothetical protein CM1200mP18_09460 [Gammaproteobacteria bacterium]|nr:MAG: hypothetical protein CM1200mP18_09460 [Gammaproteobacteria bacterium]